MKLHRITFALCYYLGLYPFRYEEAGDDVSTIVSSAWKPFRPTTLGISFKSSNVAFLLCQLVYRMINFFCGSDFRTRINRIPDHKWIDLLPYWHMTRYFLAVYCLIWMTTRERVRFCNNSLAPFTSVVHTAYFLKLASLNIFVYVWFNVTLTSLAGTTCYFETFAELHNDVIFVAFESLILFVLNSARGTLNDIEHRLKSIQTRTASRLQYSACLTIEERRCISSARMLHFECASVVENLIIEYKLLLLVVIADNYIIMVGYSYIVTLIVYLQMWTKQSNDLSLVGSTVFYIITKIIRLWTLCEADNLLNRQVKRIQYILQKLTLNSYQISLDNFEEVRIYQYQCSVNPIKLTVVGLFNLDTNFLQSFLAAALAYVVLMLQSSHVDVAKDAATSFIIKENATTPTTLLFNVSSSFSYDTTI